MAILNFTARSILRDFDFREYEENDMAWDTEKTAVIISDMWAEHWCKGATARTKEIAPNMNLLLESLRSKGVTIIHCPSDTGEYYKNLPVTAQNKDIISARDNFSKFTFKYYLSISHRNSLLISSNRIPPVRSVVDPNWVQCDCAPPGKKCPGGDPWKNKGQIADINIHGTDFLAGDDEKVLHLLRNKQITHTLIMGVHTNMCIINRQFGIKQLLAYGFNPILVRDLTDSMSPREERPFTDHFTALDRVIDYIEENLCPTTTACELDKTLSRFVFKADHRKLSAGRHECGTEEDEIDFDERDFHHLNLQTMPTSIAFSLNEDGSFQAVKIYYNYYLETYTSRHFGEKSPPLPSWRRIDIPNGSTIHSMRVATARIQDGEGYKYEGDPVIVQIEFLDLGGKSIGKFGKYVEGSTPYEIKADAGHCLGSLFGYFRRDPASKQMGLNMIGMNCMSIGLFRIKEQGENDKIVHKFKIVSESNEEAVVWFAGGLYGKSIKQINYLKKSFAIKKAGSDSISKIFITAEGKFEIDGNTASGFAALKPNPGGQPIPITVSLEFSYPAP